VTTPLLSVVVPTHQRRDSVVRLIGALQHGGLAPDRFEAVVVIDGSTDGTADALSALSPPFVLRVLEQSPAGGAARARNAGAGAARGALLLFMDDDIEPLPGCLAEHARAHEAHRSALGDTEPLVLIGAPIPVRSTTDGFHERAIWGWWEQQFERLASPAHRWRYDDVYSGVFSMPASLFADVGGFETGLPSSCRDDSEIGLRLIARGARLAFSRSAGGLHHETRDRARLIQRKIAEGQADVMLARLHPELWTSLRVSWPEAPAASGLGLLRRLAFDAPRAGDVAVRVCGVLLGVVERWRLRGLWRQLNAATMYYWYWRGVQLAIGDRGALSELGAQAAAGARVNEALVTIDLHDGVEAASALVDRKRPAALRVRYDGLPVGDVPAIAGAEPLRGAHLRTALDRLAEPLLAALALTELASGRATDGGSGAAAQDGAVSAATSNGPAPIGAGGSDDFAVSVVIPAFNAQQTIGATLDSLRAQSMTRWEAIIVDDGSTDATAKVVERYAASDPRITLRRQANAGKSVARNVAIAAAAHPWLLSLDADDTIHPTTLARVRDALLSDATLDAVHYGWAVVDSAGRFLTEERCEAEGDLFDLFARRCAFPIHACVVRRSLVEAIGGFDPAMRNGEDWPVWQRIARRGARFGRIPETLAYYLKREGSMSSNMDTLIERALRTIALGHSHDPVAALAPGAPYYDGRLASSDAVVFNFVCWTAGSRLGEGGDAVPLLVHLPDGHPTGDLLSAAECIVHAAPLAVGQPRDGWRELWEPIRPRLEEFLDALERRVARPGLARAMAAEVQRLALPYLPLPLTTPVAGTSVRAIELTEPIDDVALAPDVERLHLLATLEGDLLGAIELPVAEGRVTHAAIRDALAERFAWTVLGRYFERTSYADLELRPDGGGWSWWRGRQRVAHVRARGPDEARTALHDAIGWRTFLDELRGPVNPLVDRALGAIDRFASGLRQGDDGRTRGMPRRVALEAGEPGRRLVFGTRNIAAELRVSGAVVSEVEYVVGPTGIATERALRAALTDAAGMALCRAVVRDALLGAPLDRTSLRERIARARRNGGR
jgi:glycosyltransferase involved in cell wall biosynthesis